MAFYDVERGLCSSRRQLRADRTRLSTADCACPRAGKFLFGLSLRSKSAGGVGTPLRSRASASEAGVPRWQNAAVWDVDGRRVRRAQTRWKRPSGPPMSLSRVFHLGPSRYPDYPYARICQILVLGETMTSANPSLSTDAPAPYTGVPGDVIRLESGLEVSVHARANLPTTYGAFEMVAYRNNSDGKDHVAWVHGDVVGKTDVLVRLHSECLTGDVFASIKCDCRAQLERAMESISEQEYGVILYLRQE